MAKLICELDGDRGRILKVYDTKVVIITKKTLGSFATGNITDGEKTPFLCDVVGVQFKKSGKLIGYLQFETPSMQMNNQDSNMFSENTFTYAGGRNGVTNELMEKVYHYVTDRMEEIKYGVSVLTAAPDFSDAKTSGQQTRGSAKQPSAPKGNKLDMDDMEYDEDDYVDIMCPYCEEGLSVMRGACDIVCPYCDRKIEFE